MKAQKKKQKNAFSNISNTIKSSVISMVKKNWPEEVKRLKLWLAFMHIFKNKADALVRLSIVHRNYGCFKEAEKKILHGMEKYPNYVGLFTEYAEISMAQKIWIEAVKRWHAVLDTFKDKAPAVAFARLSIALRLQGYIEEAEKVVHKGMEKYPNYLGIFTEYAEIAMAQKDWPEALKRWQDIVNKYGDTATLRVTIIANAMRYIKDWENKRKCNICGCMLFGAMKQRKSERCLGCGSYLRTRLLYLYIQHLDIIKKSSIIFHLAPERGLYEEISKIVPLSQYIVADYDPSRYPFAKNIQKFDLCHDVEGLPDNHFDLIVHCHVMEHVPCNYSYVLKHLHRSLKEDGWHICVIPFLKGYYDECFALLSDEEAKKRFGQFDHVRRIGTDDICNTFGRVISIETDFDATKTFSPEVLLEANIPENSWKGLTTNTVLVLRKKDYKL